VAVTACGKAYAFGSSSDGQLGLGTSVMEANSPVRIQAMAEDIRLKGVSCGENHTV
jgi:alpha-tubulin suppressor-like RCC1 family protein